MTGTVIDNFIPYDSGSGTQVSETLWRSMMKRATYDGVIMKVLNEFLCYGDSSGMQVKVKSGEAWIQGNWGQNNSERIIAIANNTSGNARVDRIVLRNDFVSKQIVIDVLQGTPAPSNPVPPGLTTDSTKWEVSIATVAVANGAATINSGNVSDQRLWSDPFFLCRVRLAASAPLPAGTNLFATSGWVVSNDALDMFHSQADSGFSYIQVPASGWYDVTYASNYDNGTGVGANFVTKNAHDINSSVVRDSKPAASAGSDDTWLNAHRRLQLAANDKLYWGNWCNVACNMRTNVFGVTGHELSVQRTSDTPNTA